MKTLERKTETRQKIQLGGLIIKAGLAEEKAAVILGLLTEAKEQLASKEGEKQRDHWQALGDLAFSKTTKNT